MQQKYAKSGKFTVFLSFVQTFNEDAGKFLKEQAPTIPVYEQINLPHSPCGKGIPHAVLFDHTGAVVATGDPDELEQKVEALVKATPDPPPEILGGLEIKSCTSLAEQLATGKAIDPILKKLTVMAEKDDESGKEAKQLAEAVNKYIESEKTRLKESADATPAKTVLKLNGFLIQIKGMNGEQELRDLVAKLKKDKNVALLVTTMQQVDALQAKIAKNKKSNRADDSALAKAKETIRKMIAGGKVSESVKKEAEEFLQSF